MPKQINPETVRQLLHTHDTLKSGEPLGVRSFENQQEILNTCVEELRHQLEAIDSGDRQLSASEAIFGFCGWLTSSEKETIMSSRHECGVIVDLIKRFCEINKLDEPAPDWSEYLQHPKREQLGVTEPKNSSVLGTKPEGATDFRYPPIKKKSECDCWGICDCRETASVADEESEDAFKRRITQRNLELARENDKLRAEHAQLENENAGLNHDFAMLKNEPMHDLDKRIAEMMGAPPTPPTPENLISFRDGSYKKIKFLDWKHSQWIHYTKKNGKNVRINPANVNYIEEM